MLRFYQRLAKKAILMVLLLPSLVFAKTSNDPAYFLQKRMWDQIQAPLAWDFSTGSRDVVVAVIDTGLDTWHDDLHLNVWQNPFEIPDNKIDDDHNGYIDDIHGWDFVENTSDVRTSVFNTGDDPEAVRHGTVVAGLIGAQGDNDRNGLGLNWQVSLMPLRAIDSVGSGNYTEVVKAVNYARKNGAQVISMSFVGEGDNPELREAIEAAYNQGIVVVAAAGNNGLFTKDGDLDATSRYPACYSKENLLLTVAAVDTHDRASLFTNYGSCISVAAPGEGIYSTERYAPQFGYENEFGGEWRGTSFAAPLVAGAAALIKAAHPSWGAKEIIPLILETADSLDAVNPSLIGKLGRGRLNIGRAMTLAAARDPLKHLLNNAYFLDGNMITRFDFDSEIWKVVARVSDGSARQVIPLGQSKERGFAVLIQRSNFFYLKFFTERGSFIKEIPVVIDAGIVVKSVRLRESEGEWRPMIEAYSAKNKRTEIIELDSQGHFKRKKIMRSGLLGWTINQIDELVAVYADKKGAAIVSSAWPNGKETKRSVALDKIDALSTAFLWGHDSEQVVIVGSKGKERRQIIIDIANGSFRTRVLGAQVSGKSTLVFTRIAGQDTLGIVVLLPSLGTYSVVTEREVLIRQLQIAAKP